MKPILKQNRKYKRRPSVPSKAQEEAHRKALLLQDELGLTNRIEGFEDNEYTESQDDRHVSLGDRDYRFIFDNDSDAIEDAILKKKHFRSILRKRHLEEQERKQALIAQGKLRQAKRGKKLRRRAPSPILDIVREQEEEEKQPKGCVDGICTVQLRL